MKRCGSSPSIATPVTGSDLSRSDATLGSPDSPSTTRERLIASAKIWSLLGSSRSLAARGIVEVAHRVGGDQSGLSRSGSENTTSKPIATAPSLVRFVIRSAIRVRGHGHWPSLARLFSSMSTMVTGLAVLWRGIDNWNMSKVRSRNSWIGGGSQTASAGKDDQQRKAQQPRKAELPREPPPQDLETFHFSRLPAPHPRRARPIMERPCAIGYSLDAEDYGFFAAVKTRGGRR